MKSIKSYTWIFRCYDVKSGEVFYKLRRELTKEEADSFASDLIESNPDIQVGLFKLYKMY